LKNIRFIIGITSSGRIALGKPCSLFHTSSFAFSRYHYDLTKPFCSDASPTCQRVVAYGTPRHTFHLCSLLFIYSTKRGSRRL
jgi:hypothetical protein